ncbi:MAG: hypothetical protein NXI04_11955 [Planctomycetaceae bacterium]|nr:hypothetical protein [Planctomycetaceae bacterium]
MKTVLESSTDERVSVGTWCRTAVVLYLGTCAVRLILNLRHAMPPGMDAGYYPLQTRSLLEHGTLTGSTPPLIFWLDAVLTRVILALSDQSLNEAAILATRIIDGVAHPAVAIPVMLLGYRWSGGRRSGLVAAAACAIIALLSPPVMRMASDFQKNSLGLVWFAFALWAVGAALQSRRAAWWWAVVGFVALAALSHIGAFGATCVAVLSSVTGFWLLHRRKKATSDRPTRLWLWIGLATLGSGAAMLLLAPAWAAHLMAMPRRIVGMLDFRPHPGTLLLALSAGAVMSVPARRIYSGRQQLPAADAAVAIGCLGSLSVLLLPILNATWSMRFQLMTPLPAAVLLLYSVTQLVPEKRHANVSRWLVRAAAVVGICGPFFMQGPVLSAAAMDELETFGNQLPGSENTLVVAPHGVEFWVGLMTSAQVTSGEVPSHRGEFEHLLIVQPRLGPVGHGPAGRQPQSHGRPGGPPRHGSPRGAEHDRPAGPGDQMIVPADASLFYHSENFDVYEVL